MIARAPGPQALLLAATLAGCGAGQEGSDPSAWVCEPTSPSPSDPFALERNPASESVTLARAIADHYVHNTLPHNSTGTGARPR